MEIYIEETFFLNFGITYIILFLSSKLVKNQIKKMQMICSSFLGGVFALIFPLIKVNVLLLFVIKLSVGFFLTFPMYSKNIKKLMFAYVSFMSITFLFGGLITMINQSFNIDNFSVMVIVWSILIFAWIYNMFINKVKSNVTKMQFVYDIEIKNKDKILETKAYLDSGNVLVDSYTGKPIIIISGNVFNKIFPPNEYINLINKGRYINICTANKNSKMLVFEIDEINIVNHNTNKFLHNVAVGVSHNNISVCDGCEMLLNPMLF